MPMLTDKQIDTKIKSIKGRSATLRADIQEVLVNITARILIHGDTSPANRLMEAVGEGTRKQAIVNWLEDIAFLRWESSKETFAINKAKRDAPYVFNEEKLSTTLWYEYTREPKLKSNFDLEEEIVATIKRITKKAEKGADVDNLALAEYLKDAMIKYHMEQAIEDGFTVEPLKVANA